MNNKKIREIIKFNIQKNIQNKWFIIFNIITLVVMIFSMNTENIKDFLESKNEKKKWFKKKKLNQKRIKCSFRRTS